MLVIPPKKIIRPDLSGVLLRKRVTVQMEKSHFVGSYSKVFLKLRNLTMDDLEFRLPDGPKAGVVSLCRDADFDPAKPDVMFCAGYEPGIYKLEVVERSTNLLMAEQKFEVHTIWKDDKRGPSLSFAGVAETFGYAAAWGGGPAGPQNVNTIPANGTRRIAIVLVDTASERYPTDTTSVTDLRNRWLDELINGVSVNGQIRSTRQFYREVSYFNAATGAGLDLTAQAFGPVNLSENWATYFESDGAPKDGYYQAALTAADSLIDYTLFDTVLCVSRSVAGVGSAWPYASIGNWTFTTAEGSRAIGVVSMPEEWGRVGDREAHETFSHELGHNLRMGDQYTPAVPGRNPGNWDMMHTDEHLSHFSLAHRLMLGWANPGWLQTYNFVNSGTPIDETIQLHPIEAGAPPAGRRSGIEIRLSDGWNYYVEYRKEQAGQVGDQDLNTDSRVLVTDVDSSPGDAPISRPVVLLVSNDSDGDGPVLGNAQNFRETDNSDPTFPTDFQLSVSGIDGNKADVRVRYGVNSRPDPAIRPWPASADRQWQSPDIEVRNTRNATDSAWFNVPWAGHPNTIVATVKNNGSLPAPNVQVDFFVKNYNVGGAPESFLGSDFQSIPALGTVEFTTSWNPPGNGHYCVIVRIPTYVIPGPPVVVEMSPHNNLAQSNYTRFISGEASPASRETTFVEVGNPYDKATRVFIQMGQTNPLYRTYLQHTSLWLEPGEVQKVQVMVEYDHTNLFKAPISLGRGEEPLNLPKKPRDEQRLKRIQEKYRRVPNRMGLACFAENPHDNPRHALELLGGAEMQVVRGRKTKFESFLTEGGRIAGRVVEASGQNPPGVSTGKVLLIFRNESDPEKPLVVYSETKLNMDGRFVTKVTDEARRIEFKTLQGYYVPGPELSDTYSQVVKS